jgi:hypothetical protein
MTCFGLIAEEVAEVNSDLILRDDQGVILSVRYEQTNAMLLNEFLKEHRKAQQQEATIKEQATQIQKVNAQLEISKSAAQTVLNNR